jgi:hypothetical protein
MGAETIHLEQPEQGWGNFTLKTNCTPRFSPVSHEWPLEVEGDLAWDPASFPSEEDYTLTLSENDVSEVKSGLQHFNSRV